MQYVDLICRLFIAMLLFFASSAGIFFAGRIVSVAIHCFKTYKM